MWDKNLQIAFIWSLVMLKTLRTHQIKLAYESEISDRNTQIAIVVGKFIKSFYLGNTIKYR
jgi:hypothetical protein